MVIIIPKESLHLLANHTDNHCENTHDIQFDKAHIHCEMLAFEVSSFEVFKEVLVYIDFNYQFSKINSKINSAFRNEIESIFFRGPPYIVV